MPYPPIEPYADGHARYRRRQLDLLGDLRKPGRHPGSDRARRAGFRLLGRRAEVVRPRAVPDHPVRPAQLRPEHPARQRPGGGHAPEHHPAPDRRHGAAARASRRRQMAAARRVVGRDAVARLRGAAPRSRQRHDHGELHEHQADGARLAVPRRRPVLPRGMGQLPRLRRRQRVPAADRLRAADRGPADEVLPADGGPRSEGQRGRRGRVADLGGRGHLAGGLRQLPGST